MKARNEELQEKELDTTLIETRLAVDQRENFEEMLKRQNLWGHSAVGLEGKKAAMAMLATKTGMYAKIPLICKGETCPYAENCPLLPYDLAPCSEYCPIETAQIELRAVRYAEDFELESASFTDRVLVNEIVSMDIMLERCKALMAKEGTPVIEIVAGIAESGDEIRQPAVSKAWEAYEKISKRRNDAYQLMMATRRDKKDTGGNKEKTITDIIQEAAAEEGFLEVEERPKHLKEG